MLAARCLVQNSYLIDRYLSVHLTINIGDVKLSTNVVYSQKLQYNYFVSNDMGVLSESSTKEYHVSLKT